jgi:hypothetical protein
LSLSTTIYFASISDFIRWPSFGLSILFMVFFIITWCSRLRSEIIWGTLAFSLFTMSVFALYPTEDAWYKIAGVSAVEKANIDAAGKLIPKENQ